MVLLWLLGSFACFLLVSVPIGVSIGLAIIVTIAATNVTVFGMLGQAMQTSLVQFPLLAVPFFMLCGSLMETGGLSKRLVNVGLAFVGHKRGGLATVAILTCLFFGAISGSAPATVAAIGTIMIPSMTKYNYDKEYATGLMAVSGGLGVIIPPSIPFVLYGVATSTSVGDLFIGGVFPGILLGIILIIISTYLCKKKGYEGTGEEFSWKKVGKAIWDAKWALLVPIIILGGIYGGIFTPTEAAIVACVYGLIIGLFVYKELKFEALYKMFVDNGILVGSVIITMATATALGTIFAMLQVPTHIAAAISTVSQNKYVILLLINLFLLVVGMLMDVAAAILILAPILVQVVRAFGIDPVHFGIIMTVNLAIGFVTPPVAVSMYVASGISGVPVMRVARQAVPFLFGFLIGLAIIVMIPQLVLFLPSLLR
jgi:C4-dicarboxylate transporter DctM subunit